MTDTPLAGKLEDNPFAEVAGQLFRGKKTGVLTVTSPKKERQVVFYEGHPVAVLSSDKKEHIARFLAVKGKITKEQAEKLQQVAETKEALQSAGILTKELLTWGLKFRFINLSYDLFRWPEGSYSFEEQPPPRDYYLMKVPAPSLLLKGTKHMPPSLLMERVPGAYQVAPGPTALDDLGPLGDEEAAFLRDCREGRLVREILEDNSVEVSRARELLFAFLSLGVISLEPEPEEATSFDDDEAGMEIDALPLGGDDEGGAAVEMDLGLDGAPAAATEEAAAGESGPGGGATPDVPQEDFGGEAPAEEAPALEIEIPQPQAEAVPASDGTGAEDAPALELDPVQGFPGEGPADGPPADEANTLELELEPTAAAPEEAPAADDEPGLEIESHSYGEETAPVETAARDDIAPPALDMDGPQPLDGPPPLGFDEDAPALEPPPLESPPVEGESPPLGDTPPAVPAEEPGLPPPPWQEQEPDDAGGGHGESGRSPFAPPGAKEKAKPGRREKAAGEAPKAKKDSGPLAKVITIIALVAAAAVVGTGIWMGWKTMQSPSTPLEPIPQSPTLTDSETAEGLPVSALPTSVKKAIKEPGLKDSPPAAPTPKPAGTTGSAPAAPPAAPPESPAGGGQAGFYGGGYAAYAAGDLPGAAAAWLADLKTAGASHTIQVEVACKPDTVRNDVERFARGLQVFAVPLTLKGESCYRVLLGAFSSESEAAATLDGLAPHLKEGLTIRTLKGII